MIGVKTEFGPVAVCVPSSTIPRYMQFELSIEGIRVPADSFISRMMSGSPAANKNSGIRAVLYGNEEKKIEPRPDITHFFFQDDDQHFDPNHVLQLLQRRVPVVASLTCSRFPPFPPIVFKGEKILPNGARRGDGMSWEEIDGLKGLQPVFAIAGAGVLVERRVIEAIPDPWFELGKMDPEQMAEDLYFYEKVRNAGFPIYADFDTVMGHCFTGAAWPTIGPDGRWTIKIVFENGDSIRLGRSDPPKERKG